MGLSSSSSNSTTQHNLGLDGGGSAIHQAIRSHSDNLVVSDPINSLLCNLHIRPVCSVSGSGCLHDYRPTRRWRGMPLCPALHRVVSDGFRVASLAHSLLVCVRLHVAYRTAIGGTEEGCEVRRSGGQEVRRP